MPDLISNDASGVKYRKWTAHGPKAVFLLVHGMGASSARWDEMAKYFASKGYSSYAMELKGYGEEEGVRGHVDGFSIYYDDVISLLKIIGNENPDIPVILLGESMGALIAFMAAAKADGKFSRLICISPAFASVMKFSLVDYARIVASLFYNNKYQVNMPFSSDMITSDPEVIKMLDEDPREHRLASSGTLLQNIIAQIQSGLMKGRINVPVMFLLSGKDKLVDPKVSKKVFAGLVSKGNRLKEYGDMLHALSIEKGRSNVFEDILDWIEGR